MTIHYDDILEIPNAYDQVAPNLYFGGILSDYSLFDTVICCTPEVSLHNGREGLVTVYVPFNDNRELPSMEFLDSVVDLVIQGTNRGSTYVHCTAGINRSAIIIALTLIRQGGLPSEVVDRLRNIRSCSVLSNQTFLEYVLSR